MRLGDPAQVVLCDGLLARHVPAAHEVKSHVAVHVTASVHSGDQLDNSAQKGITGSNDRFECNLLPSDVRSIQKAQILRADPIELRVAREVFAEEQLFKLS